MVGVPVCVLASHHSEGVPLLAGVPGISVSYVFFILATSPIWAGARSTGCRVGVGVGLWREGVEGMEGILYVLGYRDVLVRIWDGKEKV